MLHDFGLPRVNDWKTLYTAALLEDDLLKVPPLIENAERAIVTRARQLFGTEENFKEQQALDAALAALHVLKSCMATRTKAAQAA
jgi:hypothetical protein